MSGDTSGSSTSKKQVRFDLGKSCWIQIARHKVFHASQFIMEEKGVFSKGRFENDDADTSDHIIFFPYSIIYWIRFEELPGQPQG